MSSVATTEKYWKSNHKVIYHPFLFLASNFIFTFLLSAADALILFKVWRKTNEINVLLKENNRIKKRNWIFMRYYTYRIILKFHLKRWKIVENFNKQKTEQWNGRWNLAKPQILLSVFINMSFACQCSANFSNNEIRKSFITAVAHSIDEKLNIPLYFLL